VLPLWQPVQAQQVASHGVPDGEAAGRGVLPRVDVGDEDAAVTKVLGFVLEKKFCPNRIGRISEKIR
jgi:hypothetical protein